MLVLAIETSGRVGSVALCRDGLTLAAHTLPEGARHARDIMPAVDRMLGESGVARHDVDAVAVSQGPGSFNGLRIGVTCAKTLAYALGWQAVGVPSLEVLVQNVTEPGAPAVACPVLDARRDKVYGTVFTRKDGEWRDATGVLILEPAELAARTPEGALVFGSGVRAYPQTFAAPRFRIGDEALCVARAEQTARVGLRRLLAGMGADPMTLVPLYYRPTEPEEKLSTCAQ